ncbi:MAG: fumarylacetoacetate hydrolase family protein [Acidimicrobiia bacterium]|nr:fumarylacetoacetate hydrolase family protein [Acidimicrobiia bacterium]
MKLVTYTSEGSARPGAVQPDGSVIDLSDIAGSVGELVAMGDPGLAAASAAEVTGTAVTPDKLLAPIRPRNNIMAVGRNYFDHAQEFSDSGFDASEVKVIPDFPIIFTKALSSIIGTGDAIDISNDPSNTSDYEGELGVVIGIGGTKIAKEDAWDHVYGYTVINDMTAREVQRRHVQFFLGKSPATYCPMGPCITTRDEIPDITKARLRTVVNGETRQDAEISQLIFDIPTLIASISETVLLEPGDIIATGTPVGCGIGFDPPIYLKAGDIVDVSVDGIGTITNPVIE